MLQAVDRQLRSVLQGQENSSPKKRTPRYSLETSCYCSARRCSLMPSVLPLPKRLVWGGAAGLKRVCELRAQPQVQMRISEGPRILWVSHYCETQHPRIAYAKARKSVRRPRSYHVFRLETDSCQRIRKRDRQFFGLKCAARGAEAAKGASTHKLRTSRRASDEATSSSPSTRLFRRLQAA
jgi:hypothetical protein